MVIGHNGLQILLMLLMEVCSLSADFWLPVLCCVVFSHVLLDILPKVSSQIFCWERQYGSLQARPYVRIYC
jgi:hypothetical protein